MSALAAKHAKALRERDRAMRRQRANGWTLARIAETHGVTKQRVHQIVSGARPPERLT